MPDGSLIIVTEHETQTATPKTDVEPQVEPPEATAAEGQLAALEYGAPPAPPPPPNGLPPGLPPHPTNEGLRQRALLQTQRAYGNAYVQRMLAPGNGARDLDVRVAPVSASLQRQGDAKANEPSKAKTNEWEKKRESIYRKVDIAGEKFEDRKTGWETWAANLGSAYSMAYTTHNDAVVASDKANALKLSIVMSIFSTVITSQLGGISEAATGFEKLGEKSLGMLEDAFQVGLGKVISTASGTRGKAATIDLDPQVYQNNLENSVRDSWRQVKQTIISAKTELDAADLKKFEDVDPERAASLLDGWLAGNPLTKEPDPIPADFKDTLEKAFWSSWLPNLKVTERPGEGPFVFWPTENTYFIAPGTDVEERLEILGIVPKGFFGIWTFDSDIEHVVNWAEEEKARLKEEVQAVEKQAEAEEGPAPLPEGLDWDPSKEPAGGSEESTGGDLDEGPDPYTGPPEEEPPAGDFEM